MGFNDASDEADIGLLGNIVELQGSMSEARIVHWWAPPSEPAKRLFLPVSASGQRPDLRRPTPIELLQKGR